MLIISFILLALGRTIPKLPPEVCTLLLETGIDNMATIVEELGIRTKAVYLPSSLNGGRPQALIPLHPNPSLPLITEPLPHRFITRYGTNPDDVGLLLSTVGTTAVGMLESKPGPTPVEFESALEDKATWCHQCLGGPLASVVASVAAEAWNRPVTIKQEEHHDGKYSVELEVAG